jgi:hypothetical protein
VQHVVYIPSRLHPSYSLLGRWLRRRVGDARRAAALFVVALAGLALALVLAHYVAWALLQPVVAADPGGPVALAFWGLQAGSVLLFLLTCVAGVRPAACVRYTRALLEVRRGTRVRRLALSEIHRAGALSPLRYHRHYRRYAATEAFVDRLRTDLLLLRTRDAVVVLELPDADRQRLLAYVEATRAPSAHVAHVA